MKLLVKAPEPRTVMEALQQRHEELSKRGEEAASGGDKSKSRRMERLSKVIHSLVVHVELTCRKRDRLVRNMCIHKVTIVGHRSNSYRLIEE
jgi:hypothetical protein